MKKKIYAPGELDKVKERLGNISEEEAVRMQKVLGGEVGYERNADNDFDERPYVRRDGVQAPSKMRRMVETAPTPGLAVVSDLPKFRRLGVPSYMERVKMDICAGGLGFGIKTTFQVLISRFSFFGAPKDMVSPGFVKYTMNEYYEKLERLVTSIRLVFPRSNIELGHKLQSESQDAFRILNVIRQWKLNIIASEIGKIQSRPRNVFVKDFETILREIYKPIFMLEKIDIDRDVRDALQLLYDIRFIEQPTKETEALYNKIMGIVLDVKYVFLKLRHVMYPLLMKTIALYYQEYEAFFMANYENYKLFLGVSEADQLPPIVHKIGVKEEDVDSGETVEIDYDATQDDTAQNDTTQDDAARNNTTQDDMDDIYDQLPDNTNEQQVTETSEKKAFERGLKMLETLFPKAPWNDLESFPDFFPYFSDVLDIKKNGELLAPEDPVHLALILSQIIEELLYGFRYIDFQGAPFSTSMSSIVDDWHKTIFEGFEEKYMPMIHGYSHYFEHSARLKNSTYAVNIATDIHWMRRYSFLPHYGYTPVTPPSFARKGIISVYKTAHRLRTDLAACAAAIEEANRNGGATAEAVVDGIINPWKPYKFEVENPLSKRLNMLLGKKQCNNASLIFFTLAVATVLDYYLCDPNSPAYMADDDILFRHTEEDKSKPVFWVEKQTGTFNLFKKSIDELRRKK